MTFKHNDIVLHTLDTNSIGIVQHGNVEWWHKVFDYYLQIGTWSIQQHGSYLKPCPENIDLPFKFAVRISHLRGNATANTNDSLIIQKIKELDYKWELKMKAKGNFFLTSLAPNVDQKTTSQSIRTDTVTASGASITYPPLSPTAGPRMYWTTTAAPF